MIEVQCPVNFMYIPALESSFLHPIIVGSQSSNDKAVILIGQRKLLFSALMYIKMTRHCSTENFITKLVQSCYNLSIYRQLTNIQAFGRQRMNEEVEKLEKLMALCASDKSLCHRKHHITLSNDPRKEKLLVKHDQERNTGLRLNLLKSIIFE